jgi:hypothetical protein
MIFHVTLEEAEDQKAVGSMPAQEIQVVVAV